MKRWGGRRATVCAVLAMTLVGTAAPLAAAPGDSAPGDSASGDSARRGAAGGARLRLGVPAYWSASTAQGSRDFQRLLAAAATSPPTVDKVVVNGAASGPADPFDPALARVIRRLRERGVAVLGYVDTGYLGRTGAVTTRANAGSTAIDDWLAQASADASRWYDLYGSAGLGGVFFDQALPTCGEGHRYVDAYGQLGRAVWRRDRGALVAINPGVPVEECYTAVADAIVVAETSLAAYRSWTPPAWVREHPATAFWHLVHGAATPEQLSEAVALARRHHAGTVYVTDAVIDPVGGPWNALPSAEYWAAQVNAARAARRGPA